MNAPSLALLTQSRLACARTCQRMHHLKYELGYRAVVELGGRKFGTLMHAGLEALWRARQARKFADECLGDALAAVQGEADAFERAKAEVLLAGYAARWPDEEYEVLAVEVQFAAELRNPATGAASRTWMLAGKIDVVVRELATGRILIVEHKTSSEDVTPGSFYWRRLRMDGQVSVYFEGARSLGFDAAACLYDVIGKPTIRPLKATPVESRKYTKEGKLYANQRDADETPEEYKARLVDALAEDPNRFFARGEVVRLETEMEDALVDVWQLGQQIRENELAKRHPRNPSACQQYGSACDFFDVCSGAADINDPSLFTCTDQVHPELEQPK
jgi:hypothetical protein